ncbi:MAG: CPBP family intramembrane glutamic endopeptidase [Myxococcota bacterium]
MSTWTRLRGALLEVGLALGGLFGGSLIFAALSAFGLLPSEGTLARGVGMAAGPVITLVAVLAYRWLSRRLDAGDPDAPMDAPFPRVATGTAVLWAVVGTLAAIGGSFVLGLLMDLVGAPIEEQDGIVALVESFKSGEGQVAFVMLAVSAVLAAPCAEELLFRGLLFRRIAGRGHVPEAFALSAAAFAAIHANLAGFVIYLWLGFVFAEAYRRSGRLWVAMLVHAGNNAFALSTLVWG